MGITSHIHMHAHKHTKISFFSSLHGEEKWMDVTGRRRAQWRHTCFLLHLLPLLLVCHFFSAHIQTSWHTLCLWGGIMLSQSRRVFPAHQRSDTTHRAGITTPPPHHFFISFDQNASTWMADPFTQKAMCHCMMSSGVFLFFFIPAFSLG